MGRRLVLGFLALVAVTLAASRPARAVTYANASVGLPPTHRWDCNPVSRELCRHPLDTGGWVGVDLADIDGDGDDDIAAVGRLLRGLHAWLSDGAGNWTESSTGLDPDCHGRAQLVLADLDGDGDPDGGSIAGSNGAPSVWLNDGAGGWTGSSAGLDLPGGEGVTTGDFDGDGFADVASSGHFGGHVRAWFGNGTGTWTERSAGLPDADVYAHRMAAGRWLIPGDSDAVVLNGMARSIAFADVQVGDTVTLRVDRRPVPLRVVGFVREPLTAGSAMVSPATFARATQRADSTNTVRVTLAPSVTERDGTRRIVDALERVGVAVGSVTAESRVAGAQGGHIYILVFALAVIALVMAVVAMIGLASSLGVSVLERTREFGVMRAIGCRSSDIVVTVLAEGLVIALLSAVAAIAMSQLVSEIVGRVLASISNQELTLSLSSASVALWVAGLLLGATLVSWYPARRAARLTVRDALAHV